MMTFQTADKSITVIQMTPVTQTCRLVYTSQMLINGLESCGLLVDYDDVVSAVWTLLSQHP